MTDFLLEKNRSKMKPRLRHFLLGCALFLILGEISARPREGRSPNLRKAKTKTQQYGDKKKQTKPSLRYTSKDQQHGVRRTSRRLKKPPSFSPMKDYNKERKRQYIMHPLHPYVHPYMFMRPPPMTQRTIVTTRIPRPPMAVPYNPFFPRSFFGGMHHHGSPFSFYDPMKMYGDEIDEDEEG